jgi:hypothetical protein
MMGNGLFMIPHDSANHHSASHLDLRHQKEDWIDSLRHLRRFARHFSNLCKLKFSPAVHGPGRWVPREETKVAKASVGGWNGRRAARGFASRNLTHYLELQNSLQLNLAIWRFMETAEQGKFTH